ncbi:MAG: hypothetical protein AAGA63_00245 [Pseudomonadota bacterium]
MMADKAYCAIYDFELLPYALGDVLTWNVQTSRLATEAGRNRVDVFICLDPNRPASIYQRGLVVPENAGLFFNELFGAFGTHPMLGTIHFFWSRDELMDRMRDIARSDEVNAEVLRNYEEVLTQRENEAELNAYFIRYIYSHSQLNDFAAKTGEIPMLVASRGCEPEVSGLLATVLAGKHIVVIHPRLRRLDAGLGGDHTYFRDSDFLEWFEFVRRCEIEYPDVQFVVMGRMQEKPLELLRRPNVTTLRAFGLGLGHELTLMLHADLFIGTSSGFAAMANFCAIPYFVTNMNKESCNAYAIEEGADRLPFAQPNQFLIYEKETTGLLLSLLQQGLSSADTDRKLETIERPTDVDVRDFDRMRTDWLSPHASTYRFFLDDAYADQETSFLVWNKVQAAHEDLEAGRTAEAKTVSKRISKNFPRLASTFPELRDLNAGVTRPLSVRFRDQLRARLLSSIDGNIIPMALRGTVVHRIARWLKNRVLGYERL